MKERAALPDAILILNPGAGSIRGDPRLLTRLKAHSALRNVEVVVATEGPVEIRDWARRALEEGRSHLLIAGGDGTVHSAVNGLLDGFQPDSLPPAGDLPVLGVLPLGTGNDLARSLGLALDPWKTLSLLDWDRVRTMDLIRIDAPRRSWCVNVVTGGMAVREEAAPDAESKADLGILSYLHQGVKALEGDLPLYDLELTLDEGETRRLKARTLVVANGRWAGAAIPVAPDARLNDGLLDLVIVPELDRVEMSLLLPRLLMGKHSGHEALVEARARRVAIRSMPEMDLSLDGELASGEEARFSIAPKAIRVMVGALEEDSAFGT